MTGVRIPRILLMLPVAGLLILLAAFLLPHSRRTASRAFHLSSRSMEPTLLPGDAVVVELLRAYRPSRGDIVVYNSVETPGLLVLSRVIALGGDTVGMTAGELFLNQPQPAPDSVREASPDPADLRRQMARWQVPVLLHPVSDYAPDRHNWGPLVVAPGTYLVLGDNRDFSYDSRFWGFVPADHIVGQPRFIYFSFDPESYRPMPMLTAIRWGRIGRQPE